jgi:hypothetical protein
LKEKTMSILKVNRRNQNLELVSKIMNSVAIKYECRVKYNREANALDFSGDDQLRRFIAEETLAVLRGG